jgi:type I restriction enzyme R subunit
MNNFSFLQPDFPALEKLGGLAEGYLYSDPNACLYKLGSLAETMVKYMFELDRIAPPADSDTPSNRIRILKREGLLPHHIGDLLYALRTKRNVAVHEGYDSPEDAETLLEMAYSLSVWFMQTYGDYSFRPQPFVPPPDRRADEEIEKLQQENEALVAELEKVKATALTASLDTAVTTSERKKRSDKAIHDLKLSEKETRYLIDERLCRVGWEANSETLRYAKGARPQKGRNLAIAEWPTRFNGRDGFADYALFAGLQLVGVVEAKARHIDISSVIDSQCREYGQGIRAEDGDYVIGDWDGYKVPFLFATNGRPYLKQLETKSGVWFRDARDAANIPKALQDWIGPRGLLDRLDKDIAAASAALAQAPYDLLRDPDGLSLRPYQIEAIEAVEAAIAAGRQTALLAMAS